MGEDSTILQPSTLSVHRTRTSLSPSSVRPVKRKTPYILDRALTRHCLRHRGVRDGLSILEDRSEDRSIDCIHPADVSPSAYHNGHTDADFSSIIKILETLAEVQTKKSRFPLQKSVAIPNSIF